MEKDMRILLPEGYELQSGSRVYVIEKFLSSGSNSVVYQAFYEDTLMPEHAHRVLIKELYPFDSRELITREDSMKLKISGEGKEFFAFHKKSFLLGNLAHLTIAQEGSERIAQNLDSFEANGTLYTVFTAKKGQVLADRIFGEDSFPTVTDAVLCVKSLLYAVQAFHNRRLLHLDISPDNIFLLDADGEGEFPTEVLLLDFNSVYSMDGDGENEGQYYLGKQGYMAPEVLLHHRGELGPWTDIYSICVVFYEMIMGEQLGQDRELDRVQGLVSPYSRLLLHEKERTAGKINEMLKKGLEVVPGMRYQSVGEMLKEVQELLDILSGAIREPVKIRQEPVPRKKGLQRLWADRRVKAVCAAAVLCLTAAGCYLAGGARYRQPEDTVIDLSAYQLEKDDSVVLTVRNTREPMKDNIMTMTAGTDSAVVVNLKDYEHPVNPAEAFEGYAFFTFYNGREDKRGWQFGDQIYSFFYTDNNELHTVLPLQDENEFQLEYVGMALQNSNKDETSVLLDITRCTLKDGEGSEYEMTDLLGTQVLFFDADNWQANLMTLMNQEYVEDFADIYGGELIVDVRACFMEPVLEVTFKSEDPDIVSVDSRGRLRGNGQGVAVVTVTARDKISGEERKTQMLVQVAAPVW